MHACITFNGIYRKVVWAKGTTVSDEFLFTQGVVTLIAPVEPFAGSRFLIGKILP